MIVQPAVNVDARPLLAGQPLPCNDALLRVILLTEDPASRTTPYLPAYQPSLASSIYCGVGSPAQDIAYTFPCGMARVETTSNKSAYSDNRVFAGVLVKERRVQ
jgi:hypothetical protein